MKHIRKNNKLPTIIKIPKSVDTSIFDINSNPAIRPIIPTKNPITKIISAKPFAVCSALKSLLDSKAGEIFLSIEGSLCSWNSEDGHPQPGHEAGTLPSSNVFPQSGHTYFFIVQSLIRVGRNF